VGFVRNKQNLIVAQFMFYTSHTLWLDYAFHLFVVRLVWTIKILLKIWCLILSGWRFQRIRMYYLHVEESMTDLLLKELTLVMYRCSWMTNSWIGTWRTESKSGLCLRELTIHCSCTTCKWKLKNSLALQLFLCSSFHHPEKKV